MKKVLIFREEWNDALLMLDNLKTVPANYEALLSAIHLYSFNGKKPTLNEFTDKLGDEAMIVLDMIFAQIDRDNEKRLIEEEI